MFTTTRDGITEKQTKKHKKSRKYKQVYNVQRVIYIPTQCNLQHKHALIPRGIFLKKRKMFTRYLHV